MCGRQGAGVEMAGSCGQFFTQSTSIPLALVIELPRTGWAFSQEAAKPDVEMAAARDTEEARIAAEDEPLIDDTKET